MTDQSQAVYAAEDLWMNKDPRAYVRFGDWNEVWPFYFTLAERCRDHGDYPDVRAPEVKPRKGALRAHYDSATATVFLPPYDSGGVWALNTGVAIHEFAHHLAPAAGHGPEFREAMLSCLDALGWDSSILADCYAEAGLSSTSKGDSVTDKVGKLLTHADKAGTDEERRTYLEKAEGLAAEHSINLALIRKKQADGEGHRDRPITGSMFSLLALPNTTYRNLAVDLGASIARAHDTHCTIRGKSAYITFYGFSEDVHLTELMLTRLTPMMFQECDRYLRSPQHKQSGVATVSARITFCQNFSFEIQERLKKAVKQTQTHMEETLAVGTELALQEKALEVRDYVAHEFKRQGVRGSWSGSRTKTWSTTAADAGRSAAKHTDIFGRKELA